MKKIFNQKSMIRFCLAFIGALFLIALCAPLLAQFAFDEQFIERAFALPSSTHWFGNDALGRDLFSRIVYATRISMSIALLTAFSSITLGIVYGSIAGYAGGWVDRVMMRIVDILYTLPSLIVVILVMLVFGRDLKGLFIALTAVGWLGTARIMRVQVLSWKKRSFVEAATALGQKRLKILLRHILPNCMAPIFVELSYQIPTNVLAEAFLSFLGIGVAPPTPSWGVLADDGWKALYTHPHLIVFPGLLIFFTMMSFNLVGDYLRDRFDPHLANS